MHECIRYSFVALIHCTRMPDAERLTLITAWQIEDMFQEKRGFLPMNIVKLFEECIEWLLSGSRHLCCLVRQILKFQADPAFGYKEKEIGQHIPASQEQLFEKIRRLYRSGF